MSLRLLLVPVAVLALAAPASAAVPVTTTVAVPTTTTIAPTTQGIIMRDGGVCDPIRHMGC